MADSTTTEESVESDKQELVTVTFRNGRNQEVTREVYPEIATFITSRLEAEGQFYAAQRLARRARQQYIWDKEDEFYADLGRTGMAFDASMAGRDWDRANPEDTSRRSEERYMDFVNGSARDSANRHRREHPNSWEILRSAAQAAGHKEVVWLVDHTLSDEYEATILVKYLPATVEELWEIAKDDHEMCHVFDRYMELAEEAGVFSDTPVPASLREQRALRNWLRRTYGDRYARDIIPQLKPAFRAEREDAVATARAEWDKELLDRYAASKDLSELLRSLADGHPLVQQHLNRSDAAKAAWERRRAQSDEPVTSVEELIDTADPFAEELSERVDTAVRAT